MVFSQRESNTNFRALKISDPAYCRGPESEVKHQCTVLVKVYTPRRNKHVGNESLLVVGIRRLLERILMVVLCSFPITSA